MANWRPGRQAGKEPAAGGCDCASRSWGVQPGKPFEKSRKPQENEEEGAGGQDRQTGEGRPLVGPSRFFIAPSTGRDATHARGERAPPSFLRPAAVAALAALLRRPCGVTRRAALTLRMALIAESLLHLRHGIEFLLRQTFNRVDDLLRRPVFPGEVREVASCSRGILRP